MPVEITLYTRQGCKLCDDVKSHITDIGEHVPVALTEVDIETDAKLLSEFLERIPVVDVAGMRFEAPIDGEQLATAVINIAAGGEPVGKPAKNNRLRTVNEKLDQASLWFSRNWVIVISLLIGIYAGLPFAAPIAIHAGMPRVGNAVYKIYSPMCHQFAFRSWFLYGDQAVYPRESAGVNGVRTFEDYASSEPYFDGVDLSTLDADLIGTAKTFYGSERMGWKVAYCERDVSIYATIAITGLVFWMLGKLGVTVPRLHFIAYLVIAIAPMGLDGFSQLFANPPFNGFGLAIYPDRESTPFLRVLTGGLFGFGNMWLAFPYIEESMKETREMITAKVARRAKKDPDEGKTGQNQGNSV